MNNKSHWIDLPEWAILDLTDNPQFAIFCSIKLTHILKGTSELQPELIHDIVRVLRLYIEGTSRESDEFRLIQVAAGLARWHHSRMIWASANAEGADCNGHSLSIVSPLFCGKSGEPRLLKSLKKAVGLDDYALFSLFRSIVLHSAKQEILHRWKESDPASAKLWRGFKIAVRKPPLRTIPSKNPKWVTLDTIYDLNDNYQPMQYDALARLVAEHSANQNLVHEIIFAVLKAISILPNCLRAIRLDDLFSALRESKALMANLEIISQHQEGDQCFYMGVEIAKDQVKSAIKSWIHGYYNDESLAVVVCDSFERALIDLLDDCVDGGPAMSYYDYLHKYNPDLSRQDYREKYRTRFEYLAEKVKNEFFGRLREEN